MSYMSSKNTFPDPRTFRYPEWVRIGGYLYRSHDVVAFGTPLTVDNVHEAYLKGIFPWYTEGLPLPWHCPELRAVLDFDDLRVPRSLAKARRSTPFTFTIDQEFQSVIRACSRSYRPRQPGTWITPAFELVFTQLHLEGMAHSIEVWNAERELVGGLYGVDAGGVFCGESMFFTEANASKLALLFLIEHLSARGATWLDSQVMTPHMAALGVREVPRSQFLDKLRATQDLKLKLF